MSDNKCPVKNYGGQAVVEGVMMRGLKHFAVVCRKQKGEIVSTCEEVQNNLGWFSKLSKVLFLRGSVALVDSMVLGTKTLMYSADIAIADEEENKKEDDSKSEKQKQKEEKELNRAKEELKKSNNKVNGIFVGFSAFLGLVIGVCLFMFVPILLTKVTESLFNIDRNSYFFALIEGIFKFLIFIGYVWIISFMPDVKRVFRYHGAEHKTINCYEKGEELTIENVQKYNTINPRCGTSFLLIFISISIIIFCFVPNPENWGKFGVLLRFGLKIFLLPIIAGISYEFIRFSGRHQKNLITRFFMAPGLWMQRLTTKEPDDKMVECAIKA
ncbi:MAG: DUF1385 domain-containing protein, partial [Abditibacteriota bacterium]|nr:DUF1385 domain-containing protein [Abditibacteriota bacterium]